MNQKGQFTSDKVEGTQTILVVDQKMTNNTAEAEVHVVHPYKLVMNIHDVTSQAEKVSTLNGQNMAEELGISPESVSETRILVEDRLYLITLQLLCKDGNRITLTENVELTNSGLLDQKPIQAVKSDKIRSQILFKTRPIDSDSLKM